MKRKIIYFLTMAVIAAFVLELFAVVMWTPREETPAATPTPQAALAWQGSAYATAKVAGLTPNYLAECNTTTPEKLVDSLKGVQGIEKESITILAFPLLSFRANATALEGNLSPLSKQAFNEELNTTFYAANCTPAAKIFQEALLDFLEEVNFTGRTALGEPVNATLYLRDLEFYAYHQGQAKPTGFLLAPATENAFVGVALYAYFEQNQLARLYIQEINVE